MVAWMVSEENSFTTGAVFDLSGGRATYQPLTHEVFDKTTKNCPPSGFWSDPWERGRPRARRPARFAM